MRTSLISFFSGITTHAFFISMIISSCKHNCKSIQPNNLKDFQDTGCKK